MQTSTAAMNTKESKVVGHSDRPNHVGIRCAHGTTHLPAPGANRCYLYSRALVVQRRKRLVTSPTANELRYGVLSTAGTLTSSPLLFVCNVPIRGVQNPFHQKHHYRPIDTNNSARHSHRGGTPSVELHNDMGGVVGPRTNSPAPLVPWP